MKSTALLASVSLALAAATHAAPVAQLATLQTYVKAVDPGAWDLFGSAVAVDGDLMVVGATGEESLLASDPFDNSGGFVGAAYVFRNVGGAWQFEAYLKSPSPVSADLFGHSVAISGDRIVIGSIGESGPSGFEHQRGAAFVYGWDGVQWTLEGELQARLGSNNDVFGWSVAIDGDTIVVGATGESTNGVGVNPSSSMVGVNQAGAAYIFEFAGGAWSQTAKLKSTDPGSFDHFGESCGVAGDLIVVGAPGEGSALGGINAPQGDDSAPHAGAAYTFFRGSSGWSVDAFLKPLFPDGFDEFGTSLSLDGSTLVVGAPGEDSSSNGVGGDPSDNQRTNSGAAFVFERGVFGWRATGYLKALVSNPHDGFGTSVSTEGLSIAVGATGEDGSGTGFGADPADNGTSAAGAAYVFRQQSSAWTQVHYLKSRAADVQDWFGSAVAVDGRRLVVGLPTEDGGVTGSLGLSGDPLDNSVPQAGAVNVFDLDLSVEGTYCQAVVNSTGLPASIGGSRNAAAPGRALDLTVVDVPSLSLGYFLTSQTQDFAAIPVGSIGFRCIGGAIGRFVGPGQILNSGTIGQFDLTIDFDLLPTPTGMVSALAGETWHFQAWFRDTSGGQATSNLSNGLSVLSL